MQVDQLQQELTGARAKAESADRRLQETGSLLDSRTAELEGAHKKCTQLDARVAQFVILEQEGESSLAQLQA